jgi:HD-like signal output (HDOD) protein
MPAVALPENQTPVREIIKQITSIATLPEVTTRIIQIVEDQQSSAADLHRVVSHDPALVTRILKVVNSAFYGLPGQIASIERAIILLGLNAVKNIAVAASLGQLFRSARLCEAFSARDLWTHCVGVGMAARDLARNMHVPLADEAFLAGMIHDVGILVSLQLIPDQLRRVCERSGEGTVSFSVAERETMGVDHQQLGQALCEHWKFPRTCQLVAGYHHRPTDLAENARLLVTLVSVADTIYCLEGVGFDLTAKTQSLDQLGYAAVGIEDAAIAQTRNNLPQLMENAAVFG